MSRAIRIVITVILACICQTDLVKYIRIATIAPDMLTVFLVLLTGYTGAYGGVCAGSLLAMLYDASVGYVLAINLVCYTFIGWAAPMLRRAMNTMCHPLLIRGMRTRTHSRSLRRTRLRVTALPSFLLTVTPSRLCPYRLGRTYTTRYGETPDLPFA